MKVTRIQHSMASPVNPAALPATLQPSLLSKVPEEILFTTKPFMQHPHIGISSSIKVSQLF